MSIAFSLNGKDPAPHKVGGIEMSHVMPLEDFMVENRVL